jgi:hypothetical protein
MKVRWGVLGVAGIAMRKVIPAMRSGGFEYRASTAQWHAERKSKRPKVAKLAANEALRQ